MLADIGEGITECEVIQWFVSPGASIEEFDPICEVQSDKASVEITSRYSGVVKKLHYDVGQMALVGKPLVDIDIPDGAESESPPSKEAVSGDVSDAAVSASPSGVDIRSAENSASIAPNKNGNDKLKSLATPAVRRVCSELGINIAEVNGSGKDGRVMKEDVLQYQKQLENGASGKGAPLGTQNNSFETLEATRSPLSGIQKQMFKSMTKSLGIPHFLYTDEVELDKLAAMRKRMNDELASEGVKLSFMPFFIKALSLALLKYPILNARVVYDNDVPMILNRPFHNIGVAMDTPNGLLVPNIKNVQNLSIYDIGRELLRLQELGSQNKLGTNELKDGTISLSNIGTVGGTYVAPVLVESEVCIGGLGKAKTIPRFDDSMNVVPRTILNSSWSGDHRVIDGVTMARMVDLWKSYVENPEQMLLRLR
jgi:2-oxoisovalerate dehydrogenase E2 component (dihydrolipoyl transacylase)